MKGYRLHPFDARSNDHRLGYYTAVAPLYLLYIDNRYGYTADCTPTVTLEQPTITRVSPSTVAKNTNYTIHRLRRGIRPQHHPRRGSDRWRDPDGDQLVPDFGHLPSWNSGGTPGSVTVKIRNSKGAISNGMTINITN